VPGLGVAGADQAGSVEGVEGVEGVELVEAVDPDAGGAKADPDDAGGEDVLGWVGELDASWAQAAMITRLLARSALPPTPLRSTK
jgi:hypothetical protein